MKAIDWKSEKHSIKFSTYYKFCTRPLQTVIDNFFFQFFFLLYKSIDHFIYTFDFFLDLSFLAFLRGI